MAQDDRRGDWIRPDGTQKGEGYLGLLARPDGDVTSELSVGVPINGKEMDIPTFVPTLSADEVKALLNINEGDKIPMSIVQKAAAFAQQRLAQGKPVFAQQGEQQSALYPQFRRVPWSGGASDPHGLEQLLLQRRMQGGY